MKKNAEPSNSLKNDRENWWIERAKEMERASAASNTQLLFQLIRQTGRKQAGVSETITERHNDLLAGAQVEALDGTLQGAIQLAQSCFKSSCSSSSIALEC